jgi:hypothetical protein
MMKSIVEQDRNKLYRLINKKSGKILLVSMDRSEIYEAQGLYEDKNLRWTNRLVMWLIRSRKVTIPNKMWLRNLMRKVFEVRKMRGRGKRVEAARLANASIHRFRQDLPLQYAERICVYLDA